jgi:hypothetical protein
MKRKHWCLDKAQAMARHGMLVERGRRLMLLDGGGEGMVKEMMEMEVGVEESSTSWQTTTTMMIKITTIKAGGGAGESARQLVLEEQGW